MKIQPTQFCDCLLRFSIVACPKSAEEKKRVIIEADTLDQRLFIGLGGSLLRSSVAFRLQLESRCPYQCAILVHRNNL